VKIQLFNNGKGLIHGDDPKRIDSGIEGTLRIGTAEVKVLPGDDTIMPQLFNGASGRYNAIFTSVAGCEYQLERVTIKGGRIVPPSQTAVELMELRCRTDALEERCDYLEDKVRELENIFDTDSLNFLIKGETK
jgi:hypothetical protein